MDLREQLITEVELAESPVQRIPSDILIDTFTDICGDPSPWFTGGAPMPFRLASVCRFWRYITLGTPSFWTSISFHQAGDTPNGARLPLLLELYVARSMDLPLKIYASMWNYSHAESLLDILIRHSNRWREIDFCIPLSILHKLNTVKEKTPLLESVAFASSSNYSAGVDGPLVDCFESAPALKALQLSYHWWDIRVPWIQIIDFTQNFIPLYGGLRTAVLCSNLVSLTLVEWVRSEGIDNVSTLPNLRSLKIFTSRGSSRTSVLDVFSYITVPRLTSLKVHAVYPNAGLIWKVPHFVSLVNRSEPFLLRSLDLKNIWMDPNTFIRCLEAIPSLRTLMVTDYKRDAQKRPRVISRLITSLIIPTYSGELTASVTRTVLLPRLTSLTLAGTFKDDHLMEMIESRLRQLYGVEVDTEVVRLQHISLHYTGCHMHKLSRAKIQELVQTGVLDVDVWEGVPVLMDERAI